MTTEPLELETTPPVETSEAPEVETTESPDSTQPTGTTQPTETPQPTESSVEVDCVPVVDGDGPVVVRRDARCRLCREPRRIRISAWTCAACR
jgi:hypothetical protein